jgi:hypothetical protein
MFQARMYLWQMRRHDLILAMVTQLKGSTCPSTLLHEFQVHLNASPTRVEQIKKKTAKDPELHSLKTFVTHASMV